MLKSILIITVSVFNLGETETAYRDYLDHETVGRGEVSAELGAVWDADSMTGRNMLLMQPESDAPVYHRYCRANGIPPLPVALAHADVCRDDLLFEIELDAVRCE